MFLCLMDCDNPSESQFQSQAAHFNSFLLTFTLPLAHYLFLTQSILKLLPAPTPAFNHGNHNSYSKHPSETAARHRRVCYRNRRDFALSPVERLPRNQDLPSWHKMLVHNITGQTDVEFIKFLNILVELKVPVSDQISTIYMPRNFHFY